MLSKHVHERPFIFRCLHTEFQFNHHFRDKHYGLVLFIYLGWDKTGIHKQTGSIHVKLTLLSSFNAALEVEKKMWKNNISFQRSPFNLHLSGMDQFRSASFILEIREKEKSSSNGSGIFKNVPSQQLSGPVSYVCILWIPNGAIFWTSMLNVSRS